MKLLSSALSPFAARVRLAIHAKSLPVEISPANMWTSTGMKSPEYLAVNPIGKVPTLILDDGSALPESDTIVEFLADSFPQAGLRPADPQAAARGRLLARVLELYVMSPVWGTLFAQVFAPSKDVAAVEAAVAKAEEGLRHLEHFMPEGVRCAVSDDITTADCALVPMLFFQSTLVRACGGVDPLPKFARVASYVRRMRELPAVQRLLTEMREGLAGSRLAFLLAHAE
jgi:glutathione S-transferase